MNASCIHALHSQILSTSLPLSPSPLQDPSVEFPFGKSPVTTAMSSPPQQPSVPTASVVASFTRTPVSIRIQGYLHKHEKWGWTSSQSQAPPSQDYMTSLQSLNPSAPQPSQQQIDSAMPRTWHLRWISVSWRFTMPDGHEYCLNTVLTPRDLYRANAKSRNNTASIPSGPADSSILWNMIPSTNWYDANCTSKITFPDTTPMKWTTRLWRARGGEGERERGSTKVYRTRDAASREMATSLKSCRGQCQRVTRLASRVHFVRCCVGGLSDTVLKAQWKSLVFEIRSERTCTGNHKWKGDMKSKAFIPYPICLMFTHLHPLLPCPVHAMPFILQCIRVKIK